jgi:hypothetical protein
MGDLRLRQVEVFAGRATGNEKCRDQDDGPPAENVSSGNGSWQ